MVIYSRAILVAVTSWCRVKPGLGPWQTVQAQIRRGRTRHQIRVCTVCLNYKKLRVKWISLKSPFRTIFSAYSQRQSIHQCCQCFDLCRSWRPWMCVSCFWNSLHTYPNLGNYVGLRYIQSFLGNRLATFFFFFFLERLPTLFAICSFCGCLIVFVSLSKICEE